jgi:hypothetical protein
VSKLIFGVGVNDAPHAVQKYHCHKGSRKLVWICPFFRRWRNMIERCYSEYFLNRRPTYRGCSVCEEWLTFSKFKVWMEKQDWEGKELDKDILVKENKVYSPETCCFVTKSTNNFMHENNSRRGDYAIGVSAYKNKLQASCKNPITGDGEHLGYFTDEMSAHLAWKKRKHELACQLADMQTDDRVAAVLRVRYL